MDIAGLKGEEMQGSIERRDLYRECGGDCAIDLMDLERRRGGLVRWGRLKIDQLGERSANVER